MGVDLFSGRNRVGLVKFICLTVDRMLTLLLVRNNPRGLLPDDILLGDFDTSTSKYDED